MKKHYDHSVVEPVWQKRWEDAALFQQSEVTPDGKEKEYLLFAFAYPSGSGLHVGHVESKTALDILARFKRMNGTHVFFPVGWDAFGLPAENYAVKTGIHPAETTRQAIDTFRSQIQRLAISYDWANEVATSHPEYYRWTQWLFLEFFNKGLAYRNTGLVNWCPSCQTVLANEQVVDGECERCGTTVVQKELEQWYLKITQYAEELIQGLDDVDWPSATKDQQLHWIGKSEGAEIAFGVVVDGQLSDEKLSVFSTAHDTIYGCTFMVIAPEHHFLRTHQGDIKNWAEVAAYIEQAKEKNDLDRQVQKEKTGVKVDGIALQHPLTGQTIPLYIADYVLAEYGTGAVMAVPAHDTRDKEFAQKYDLPIVSVVKDEESVVYSDIKAGMSKYILKNSQEFDGLTFEEGRQAILKKLIDLQVGQEKKQYKLRDWLISRQRYWGAPIPIVYDPQGMPHPVREEHLPWLLPTDVDFLPKGESPLRRSKEFFERTERLYGAGWTPECDTMDTFVDSSWYYLRYVDARNTKEFARKEQLSKLLPVDLYLIGPEHIVLHLLYSRFFTKFLRDQGYLSFDEPFQKMRHQGMILGPNGKKMSKSKGNVINPDEIIEKYGADTLRVYEMFMGPLESDKPWDTGSVIGVYRFLQRIYHLFAVGITKKSDTQLRATLHQTIKKVTEDIPELKFNTAIAALMICVNSWENAVKMRSGLSEEDAKSFAKILAPFAPFLAEELYQSGNKSANILEESIHITSWPAYVQEYLATDVVTVVIQVNGKVRSQMAVATKVIDEKEALIQQAMSLPELKKWLDGHEIVQSIYVKGKVINFVVR